MMPSWRQSSWPSVQVILSFTWYITEYSYTLATRDEENCFSAISLLSRSISFTVKVGLSVLMQTFLSLTSRCAMLKLSCSSLRASWTDPTNVFAFCLACSAVSGGLRSGNMKKTASESLTFPSGKTLYSG